MAFNPQPIYSPGYQPQYMPAYQAPQQTQQIQNGGFISVANIDIARNWPIAPGNSITFKDENAPYVYTKTMGFSQLDRPIFEKFRLVKEEDAAPANTPAASYALKSDLDALNNVLDAIKGEMMDFRTRLDGIAGRNAGSSRKEEEVG